MTTSNEITEQLISEAIEKNELLLHYQLQSSVKNNKIVGIEALTRWESTMFGQVDTGKFIEVLERSSLDLVAKFHQWTIHSAFTQIVKWRAIGITVPVFLNFSTRYLQEEECLTFIKDSLRQFNLPASCFGIEVTESCEITNMFKIQSILKRISQMGIEIALDDFCTSYCSLEYLTKLPASKIKIDKQFIQNMGNNALKNPVAIIVESLVDMALKLGVEVIAEGVETLQQLEQITYLGCDSYQGYFHYPPVPASYISGMVLKNQSKYHFTNPFAFSNMAIAL